MDKTQDCNRELDTLMAGLGARNLEEELSQGPRDKPHHTSQRDSLQKEQEQFQASLNAAG